MRQALGRLKGGPEFRAPKTSKSQRRISLLPLTAEVLQEHRTEQLEERLRVGPVWQDRDLVCPAADGSPWHPATLTTGFRELVRLAGLTVTFHGLRQTHATQLLRQGIHPKVVSERLGHSTVGLTLDTYSHVLPGMQEDAAAKLGGVLRRALATTSSEA